MLTRMLAELLSDLKYIVFSEGEERPEANELVR